MFKDFYNGRQVEGSSNTLRRVVLKLLKKYNIKAQTYLDIGTGTGEFASIVAKCIESKQVYGIDINEVAVKLAQAKGINAVLIDVNSLSFPWADNCFDFITAIEVIEHLVNSDFFLSEINRVLKPGGYFVVSSPNLASWLSMLSLSLGYLPPDYEVSFKFRIGKPLGKRIHLPLAEKPIGHIKPYIPRALKEHVEKNGFEVRNLVGVRLIESSSFPLNIIGFLDKLFSIRTNSASGLILIAKKKCDVYT